MREEIWRFAEAMEQKLQENDHKTSWKYHGVDYFMRRILEELEELEQALKSRHPSKEYIKREAADIANFAMFIFDHFSRCRGKK